jgi:Na+/melibiose symporter-like transporter
MLVAAAGEPAALGLNALTFGLSAVAWGLVRRRFLVRREAADSSGGPAGAARPGRDVLAGIRLLWFDRLMRSLVLLEFANSVLVAGVTLLFIYYLRTVLNVGSVGVGVLLSVASVGAVLAAVLAARLRSWLGVGRAWLLAVAVQGVALAAVSVTHALWSTAALAVAFAFGQILALILATSVRQERTPDSVLGRVSATVLTLMLLGKAIGGPAGTAAAGVTSPRAVFVALGVANLLLVLGGLMTPLRRPAEPVGPREAT